MMKKALMIVMLSLMVVFLVVGCQDQVTVQEPETPEDPTPVGFSGFSSLEEAAVSENWKENFPVQYEQWFSTGEMKETPYGGSITGGKFNNYLETYPFLKTNYNPFPFSVDYNRSRGHMNALESVKATQRLADWEGVRKAACLTCKSTDVVVGIDQYGDDWYGKTFAEIKKDHTIGCLNCHDHETAEVKLQYDFVDIALNYETFENGDPRDRKDIVCAQCHVNYHFHSDEDTKDFKIRLPWTTGMTVEAQLEHYDAAPRSDEFTHAITGATIGKIQHPEYELYYEGKERSIHAMMNVGCNDCHMPQMEVDGETAAYHGKQSPYFHVEESCMGCHTDKSADEIIAMGQAVQKDVYEKQNKLGYDIEAFILAVGEKIDSGSLEGAELEEIQALHREAQFYWDYIWVENSNGFHNWAEAHRVLDNANALIVKGMDLIE